MKKLILIDLDGVLNDYNGDFRENYIPKMKLGADTFLKNLSSNYIIKIFTTRNKLLTTKWLFDNKISEYVSDIVSEKLPAFLYIDDRCICFKNNFEIMLKEIEDFKPHWE